MHSYIAIQNTYDIFEMALFINAKLVDHVQEDKRHTSKMFIPLLDQLCSRNNITFSDLSFCAVNAGPGPFSTLRSIIASVNGLHFATNVPLISIDGLDATFIEFYDPAYAHTVVLLNAFNNEVYYLIAEHDHVVAKGYEKIDTFLQNLTLNLLSSNSNCARPELVEGSPRALEDILLPQFSFHSKPGTPSEETEDGVIADERNKDLSKTINFLGNGVTLHQNLIKQILGNNAIIKENNPSMCSIETIGMLGLKKYTHKSRSDGYLMPLHLKKHAVEL